MDCFILYVSYSIILSMLEFLTSFEMTASKAYKRVIQIYLNLSFESTNACGFYLRIKLSTIHIHTRS